MVRNLPGEEPDGELHRRLEDELIGLDRDDPEVQEFAEHLARVHRQQQPGFTIEGTLSRVADFADSANRAQGSRRMAAVVLVALVLTGLAYAAWEIASFALSTFLG